MALPQPNYSPETIDTAWLAIREWLAPCLLGRAFTAAAEVHAVLEENVRGHKMAKAALERRRGSHTPWPSTSSGIAASADSPRDPLFAPRADTGEGRHSLAERAHSLRVLESSDGAHIAREAAASANVRIRPLASLEDCNDCVDLQREVWGFAQPDIVPASLLHVVDYVGGIAAGAFDADGTLLGFVFGITGIHEGELAHWSHMVGVRESARNMGVGRMLKEHQRRALAGLSVARIFWTFDPLMAKNAYFNLNRLGAEVVEYVPNMYGVTASPLHVGLPTDRLVVCLTTIEQPAPPLTLPPDEDLPVMTTFPRSGDRTLAAGDERPPIVLLEIPADILDDMTRASAPAATWRLSVREHFQWALQHAYSARGVHRNATSGRSFYVMVRDT